MDAPHPPCLAVEGPGGVTPLLSYGCPHTTPPPATSTTSISSGDGQREQWCGCSRLPLSWEWPPPARQGVSLDRGAATPSNFHKIKNTVTQASRGPAHKHVHNPSKHNETQTKTTETSNQCARKQQTYESQFGLTITLYQSWCCCRPGYVYWVGWAHWASRPTDTRGASGRPVERVQGRGGSRASLATLSYATWIQRLVRVAADHLAAGRPGGSRGAGGPPLTCWSPPRRR